jgi:hypothetical protein
VFQIQIQVFQVGGGAQFQDLRYTYMYGLTERTLSNSAYILDARINTNAGNVESTYMHQHTEF